MAVDPTPGIFYDPSTTITLTVAVKPACPPPPATPGDPRRPALRVRARVVKPQQHAEQFVDADREPVLHARLSLG